MPIGIYVCILELHFIIFILFLFEIFGNIWHLTDLFLT